MKILLSVKVISRVHPSSVRLSVLPGKNYVSGYYDFFFIRFFCTSRSSNRLTGQAVKTAASRVEDPGFESRLRRDFSRGRVIPVTSKLTLQWLPRQAPGVIGSALGLIGRVSVYCDWVRWKVWSAASISVWQHVNCLSRLVPEIHLQSRSSRYGGRPTL